MRAGQKKSLGGGGGGEGEKEEGVKKNKWPDTEKVCSVNWNTILKTENSDFSLSLRVHFLSFSFSLFSSIIYLLCFLILYSSEVIAAKEGWCENAA